MGPESFANAGDTDDSVNELHQDPYDYRYRTSQFNNDNHHHYNRQSHHHQNLSHPTITSERPNKPIGVSLVGSFFRFNSISSKRTFYKAQVFCVTFIAYTCYHMGRRPLSIVKNVLNRNCSEVHNLTSTDQLTDDISYIDYEENVLNSQPVDPFWCDWAPFNNDATANQLLAILDSSFLFAYAFFMFFSGFLADRCNLRYYLSAGMILSGLLLIAFGLAYPMNIHSMSYFMAVQIISGAIQTTGWPTVIACIGNWFDQSSRGAVFGLWNSNTNLGNILGAMIAGYYVEKSWDLSFIVPGSIITLTGFIVFLFLVPRPSDVGLLPVKQTASLKSGRDCDIEGATGDDVGHLDPSTRSQTSRRKPPRATSSDNDSALSEVFEESQTLDNSEQRPLISAGSEPLIDHNLRDRDIVSQIDHVGPQAASFMSCLKIPGVLEYSLSLGFSKLVSYTFLYWLPRYITQSTVNNSEDSAYLSVPFDIGGMMGALLAGHLSDKWKRSATTCTVMLIMAIPSMFIYQRFAAISNYYNISIQLLVGLLVSGPCALITTAVSADLGSRIKDGKAMATVAAIIDGTGSIGAAIGPLFAGYVSDSGWQTVFLMLMASDLLASLCLIRLTLKELGLK